MSSFKKHIKIFGKLLVTGIALYWVLLKIDVSELLSVLTNTDFLYLLPAIIFFVFAKYLESLRFGVFLDSIEVMITRAENFKLYLLGMFYNLFFPGGIGGDFYKIYWIKKRCSVELKKVVVVSFFNRVVGMLALCTLALLCLPFVSLGVEISPFSLLIVPAVYTLSYWVYKVRFGYLFKTFFSTSVLSFFIQLTQLVSAHCILMSLGVSDLFFEYWFVYLVSGLVFILPITIGGVGAREIVFVYGADILSIDISIAIALSLVIYSMRILVSLGGLNYMLKPDNINLK